MIRQHTAPSRSTREAADWLTRLSDPRIETEELEAFSSWRSNPANKAEYERLEDLVTSLRDLDGDPDIEAVAAEALKGHSGRIALFGGLAGRNGQMLSGALAAVMIVGVSVALVVRSPTYATGVGETFGTRLADGSRLVLDTDSRVKVRFSAGERRIELLRGQALFEVAHNAARPFIVVAGDTRTRALGTKFEVRRVNGAVKVTLTQGSVEVTDGDAPATRWRLTPGQALALPPRKAAEARPVSVDVKSAASWTSGDLTFEDVTLADAVAEINRYNRDKIILGEGVPVERRVSGIFPTGDNTDLIAVLTSVYGLRTVRKANGDIVLQPKVPEAT